MATNFSDNTGRQKRILAPVRNSFPHPVRADRLRIFTLNRSDWLFGCIVSLVWSEKINLYSRQTITLQRKTKHRQRCRALGPRLDHRALVIFTCSPPPCIIDTGNIPKWLVTDVGRSLTWWTGSLIDCRMTCPSSLFASIVQWWNFWPYAGRLAVWLTEWLNVSFYNLRNE